MFRSFLWVSIILSFVGLHAEAGDKPYVKAPSELLARHEAIWAGHRDDKTREDKEATLAAFLELNELAVQGNHPRLAHITWDAIRIHYEMLEYPIADKIRATKHTHDWKVRYQQSRGRSSLGDITMLSNLHRLYRQSAQMAMSQQVYQTLKQIYIGYLSADEDGNPKPTSKYLRFQHFQEPHIFQMKLRG